LGAELGADIVKVAYTGSPEGFREVVEGAIVAGGAGVSIGRNVFQHKNPSRIVRAICKIVHDGSTVKEGLKELGQRG